jgi:hypothetical protein
MSYRLKAACIISTAQQARPKVKGHSEPARAQEITDKSFVEIHSSFIIGGILSNLLIYNVSRKDFFIYLVNPSGREVPYTDRRFFLNITGEKS